MIKAHLCQCNNCMNILIDQNSKINAKEYELTGEELEMQYLNDSSETDISYFWGCPICMTDEYLIDL